jgi:hypothetical protein
MTLWPMPPSSGVTTIAPSSTPPLDHLAPGELQASAEFAFGFPIPTTMRIERAFPNAVHLVGEVEVQGLIRYVQAHAQTKTLELKGNAMVFESVRFKAAGPTRLYRIEITGRGPTTRMLIKDDTLTDSPPEPGLTDEERWRRAGMKPNGEPLDVSRLN